MGVSIKVNGVTFSKVLSSLPLPFGYPIKTALSDLYFLGTYAGPEVVNVAPGGAAPAIVGSIDYGDDATLFASGENYIETGTLDTTQNITLLGVADPGAAATTLIGNFGQVANATIIGTNAGNFHAFFNGGGSLQAGPAAPAGYSFFALTVNGTEGKLHYGAAGVLQTITGPGVPSPRAGLTATNPWYIGGDKTSDALGGDNAVVMAAIHKTALTNAQVNAVYQALRASLPITVN